MYANETSKTIPQFILHLTTTESNPFSRSVQDGYPPSGPKPVLLYVYSPSHTANKGILIPAHGLPYP